MTADPGTQQLGSLGWRLLLAFAGVAVSAIGLVVVTALIATERGAQQAVEVERERVAVQVAAAAARAFQDAGGWQGADLSEAEAIAAAVGARLVLIGPDGSVDESLDAETSAASYDDGSAVVAGPAAREPVVLRAAIPAAAGPPGAPSPSSRADRSGSAGSPTRAGVATTGPTRSPSPSPSPSRASGSGPTRPPTGGPPTSTRPSTGPPSSGSATAAPTPAPTAVPTPAPVPTGADPVASAPVIVDGTSVGLVGLVFPAAEQPIASAVAWRWIGLAALGSLLLALLVGLLVTRRIAHPLLAIAGTAQSFAAGDRDTRTGVTGPGEIGAVARSVDEMADAVVRSEGSQRRLAASVAHELRTPLAALQLGLEEVRDGLVVPDAQLLTSLHDQSLRLGRIVDDLAALSSADATAFSLRWSPVDLSAVAASEVLAQEPRLRAAGLTVTTSVDETVWVDGDADRLRQVVANLLSNAARYCRPGDRVDVTVRQSDGLVRLVVRDTGPGIPRGDLPHVLDRFWRGSRSTGTEGLGLGLAVVRELVVAHHGSVRLESDGSSGTTAVVELPQARGGVA